MRAVGVTTFGGPDGLRIVDLPVPEPAGASERLRPTGKFEAAGTNGRLVLTFELTSRGAQPDVAVHRLNCKNEH